VLADVQLVLGDAEVEVGRRRARARRPRRGGLGARGGGLSKHASTIVDREVEVGGAEVEGLRAPGGGRRPRAGRRRPPHGRLRARGWRFPEHEVDDLDPVLSVGDPHLDDSEHHEASAARPRRRGGAREGVEAVMSPHATPSESEPGAPATGRPALPGDQVLDDVPRARAWSRRRHPAPGRHRRGGWLARSPSRVRGPGHVAATWRPVGTIAGDGSRVRRFACEGLVTSPPPGARSLALAVLKAFRRKAFCRKVAAMKAWKVGVFLFS
jgi:hypothetical protein